MKHIKYLLIGFIAITISACNDFLNTIPKDALSPETAWRTPEDAEKFLIGCYDGWESGSNILYLDCGSDFGYNHFPWEGFTQIGNGTLSQSNTGTSFYDFKMIRRCNTFLENIDKIDFPNEEVKKDLIAQVRVIRAYKYFIMNWWYGGVAIIENYKTADEAKVPRNSEQEVKEYIESELDTYTKDLNVKPSKLGRIAQGAALAIRMREALYYGDWEVAKARAKSIIDLNQYELETDYNEVFRVSNKSSKEIILSVQYLLVTKPFTVIGQMYNSRSNGWSSIVPTQNLVDTYEMSSGLMPSEYDSDYDPAHPFANRDPRLAMTVFFPGADYTEDDGSQTVFNTLDRLLPSGSVNGDYMNAQDSSSKTCLTWAKYLNPITQYAAGTSWSTEASPIVFRYAEVLLSYAEAENELNGPSEDVYKLLDQVRARVDMPRVDREKYSTKDKLRELIHRERSVELAGEGLRRSDIIRWTSGGKMLAEEVLNGTLNRIVGTVNHDKSIAPGMRATINLNASSADKKIEDRMFKSYNRYLPIPQESLDSNPLLEQNEGYK